MGEPDKKKVCIKRVVRGSEMKKGKKLPKENTIGGRKILPEDHFI